MPRPILDPPRPIRHPLQSLIMLQNNNPISRQVQIDFDPRGGNGKGGNKGAEGVFGVNGGVTAMGDYFCFVLFCFFLFCFVLKEMNDKNSDNGIYT